MKDVFDKFKCKLNEVNLYSVYDTSLTLTLPKDAQVHGKSVRTEHPIFWSLKSNSRILGIHAHPSFNTNIMHELIVNKLYENGKIDDPIKIKFMEDIYDSERPVMPNTMLKVIRSFI